MKITFKLITNVAMIKKITKSKGLLSNNPLSKELNGITWNPAVIKKKSIIKVNTYFLYKYVINEIMRGRNQNIWINLL